MLWTAAAAAAVLLAAAIAGKHFLLKACHAWRLQWAGEEAAWELAERLERSGPAAREAAEDWYLAVLEAERREKSSEKPLIEHAPARTDWWLTSFYAKTDGPRKRAAARLAEMASGRAIESLSLRLEEADPDLPLIELETDQGPLQRPLHYFHYTTLALYRLGPTAIPSLSRTLRSTKLNVRLQAALALSLLGRESTAAISALLVAVMDNVWDGRNQVLDALVATNPLPGQGLEILLELVRHDEQLGPAVNGLARLAIGNAGALNALCELLLDESAPPAQRRATAEVLGVYKLGSGMVVSALVRALEAGDCSLRFAAVDSLGKLEPHEEAVVKALTNRLHEDVEATLRRRAAYVLGQIGTASAVRALREALGDEDLDVRRAAESALQRLEDI